MPHIEAERPRRTPLFPLYSRYGARVVDFHGWELPVQFSGIIEEHLAVRSNAGLFDISHMGEIEISGKGSQELVQYLTINDVSHLKDGQVQYSAMCFPDGGIIDDLTVYRFHEDRHLLCVNAANREKDLNWIIKHRRVDVDIKDRSDSTALIAVQGPKSEYILHPLVDVSLQALQYYHFVHGKVGGVNAIISRTGYTGEDGFEIFTSAEAAQEVWQKVLAAGSPVGMKPAGLGARDTLRMEMKYILYGNEIDHTTDPIEGGLGWITKLDKDDFIGKEALLERKRSGSERKLAAFEVRGRGVARQHCPILAEGKKVGEVTSGTFSPSLRKSIGIGYVPVEFSGPGSRLEVEVRGSKLQVEVVKAPFYKHGSVKK